MQGGASTTGDYHRRQGDDRVCHPVNNSNVTVITVSTGFGRIGPVTSTRGHVNPNSQRITRIYNSFFGSVFMSWWYHV